MVLPHEQINRKQRFLSRVQLHFDMLLYRPQRQRKAVTTCIMMTVTVTMDHTDINESDKHTIMIMMVAMANDYGEAEEDDDGRCQWEL